VSREVTTVRYLEGATHGFDSQTGPKHFDDDPIAHAENGETVNVIPDASTAAEVRQAVTNFFLQKLKR
jgi:hypothetical protein